MPKIDCKSFTIGDGPASAIESAVSGSFCPIDNARVIGSIDEALALLRNQHSANGCIGIHFRVRDFPFLYIRWQQFGLSAAIVHTFRGGNAERIHLLLTGRDLDEEARLIESLRNLLGKSFPTDFNPSCRNGEDVVQIAFVIRAIPSEDDFSDLLPFIALVPIFCEFCGMD